AWATSLADARLARLRAARPTGVHAGAYGWLTHVRPRGDAPASDGYIVTPSFHHATTAAVLRSGWLAHSAKAAFAVDLPSWRVRRGLAVGDGVRTGQPPAALLGYELERGLHDAKLDRYIDPLRRAYPLPAPVDAAAPGTGEALEAVGARNVVDGQALRRDR